VQTKTITRFFLRFARSIQALQDVASENERRYGALTGLF
jgi:hypothetical protein